MALVVNQSKDDVTVIILDDNDRTGEAEALTDLLDQHPTLSEDFPVLDELANALISLPYEEELF